MFKLLSFYRKEELYAFWGILLSMTGIPFAVAFGHSFPIFISISLFILWMIYKNKSGYSLIIASVCLCEPSMTTLSGDIDIYNNLTRPFIYFLFFIPLSLFLIKYYKKDIPYKITFLLGFLYLVIGWFYGIDLARLVSILVSIHLAFYIGLSDKVSIDSFFRLFTLILIITTIYASLDYHLMVSPYLSLYMTMDDFMITNSVRRAVGLLGNPLLLLFVAIFYQAMICSVALKRKKIPIIPQIICLYLFLITVSRTAIIAIFLFYLYYFHAQKRIMPRQILSLVSFLILISFMIYYYLPDTLDDLYTRLQDSNTTHRQSGFETTVNILSDNLFGIGFTNFDMLLEKYAAKGKESHVNTLDNFFLTQIAHYGILCVIIWLNYMIHFYYGIKKRLLSFPAKELSSILLAFLLCAFCFDFEAYNNICMFMYIIIGGIFARNINYKIIRA